VLVVFVALAAVRQFGWVSEEMLDASRLAPIFTLQQAEELIGSL